MDSIQAIALALIQGITEFLPISSSAHLILPSQLLGWPDQGLAFDTAVHLGSLIAVVFYFRVELVSLVTALVQHVHSHKPTEKSRFAINLILASLPIIPVGYLTRFFVESELRGIGVITFTTVFFAFALWLADHLRSEKPRPLTPARSIMIGFAQCLALIPGTSRSGVTITMALLLGQSREQAARFSFLISIPAIAGAASLKLWDLLQVPVSPDWMSLGIATTVAGLSSYLCILAFLNIIDRVGYLPFVAYRVGLGCFLLWMIY